MDKSRKNIYTLRYLLSKSLEGNATADEMARLDSLIVEDPEARHYYAEFLHLHVSLRKLLQQDIVSLEAERDEVLDVGLWRELARHEQMAETVVVEQDDLKEPLQTYAEKGQSSRPLRKFSRFSMVSVAASIAAVLFVVLYIHLVPPAKPVVATLTDSINVQWADPKQTLRAGDEVRAETYRLQAGIVSLTFESGAEVVIEGPAEYNPVSFNKMNFQSGKAFAHVPQTAIGFTIGTPESSIVDLGTDFGVAVDPVAGSEVHVYKGKVNLVAGLADQPKKSEILQQHEARKVDAEHGVIRSAEFKKYLFAQKISSKENRVVYGRPVSLASLTDLVMGGNGYGTSQETSQIYAVSSGQKIIDPTGQYRTINNPYQKVSSNPFIDGIFVPDGNNQVVSSEGHVFAECPDTSGFYYYNLCFDKNSKYASPVAELYQKQRNLNFASNLVFMHSNIGVTFNLDAVRGQFSDQSIRRFQASVGTLSFFRGYAIVPAEQLALNYTEFDVWIVVDGQLRAKTERVHWDSLLDLDVPLAAEDRFLTIIVTDGGIIRSAGNNENHYDLCGLADMRFEMESIE
jgi:hypothetical protein